MVGIGKSADAGASQQSHLISPPTITLPKGGGAIRGIGEKFAANPVTGTGSMTVPIATSPGRSGFGPQLSLSYDSGAGNGPFGFGWSLSLPAITRKTDKGLPQYRDAEDSDEFILSGAEDLVPVFRKDHDGEWVRDANGDFVIHEDEREGHIVRRYRPRIEGLFARIERWTRQSDGDVHWRSISRDNILTLYGKDAQSRIADPEDPRRVFSWLICETRDDKGNGVLYNYKPEDGAGVDLTRAHERNRGGRDDPRRTANRYLKQILYGNRTTLLDADGHRPRVLTDTQLQDAGWMFEVVFDYGEHDAEAPTPDDSGQWNYRDDPFSVYRAGFEVRTTRLCQRVLMFHHIPDISKDEKGYEGLVRSTDFTYSHEQDPDNARNPVYTFLCAVTQTGHKRKGNGYLSRCLPPVEFEYTQPVVQDLVEEVDASSLENLPTGVGGRAYQWTDLHGEGIPGILTEQGGTWFYKRNLSPISEQLVEFAPLEQVADKPNLALARGAQFMDLAGDGQPDLVVLDGPMPGLYEHDGKESWQSFRPFTARLNRDTRDPNMRFVDLDGDGHADVLITEDEAMVWHASLAEAGFGPARRVHQALDEEKGPRLVFADGTQSIYLADLSGDGLTDLVRIRSGQVCYWPNLGYGRFGEKVAMDHAPHLDEPDQFDHSRIRLADIDGTGTTDIIYLHRDGVRLYFNQSGNGWSEPQVLNVSPQVEELVSIVPADLLGNGTACLVWSSTLVDDTRRPMRYVNLMGGQKPHLLVKTANNLGAETHVHYAPSTKFYLQDKRDGKPWITRLPYPVHVVERVETFDHISRNRFVTRYAYHHGYFDGVEREFRGFGMVEQWDTEEFAALSAGGTLSDWGEGASNEDQASHVPPVLTRTWFHTGAYVGRTHISNYFAGLLDANDIGEYYREPGLTDAQARELLLDDTILPTGLSVEEEREACRALKGSMLRQEVYALDGTDKEPHPYTVTEQNFTIRPLQPKADNRHAVFFTHAREAVSYHYERNPADPRIAHAITLEVDNFGNVLKEAAIGYGRRLPDTNLPPEAQAKQAQTLVTYTENRVTNAIENADNDYRTPLPCETRTYELTGYTPTGPAGRFQHTDFVQPDPSGLNGLQQIQLFDGEVEYEATPPDGRQRRLIEHLRNLYRSDDLGAALNDPLALLSLGTVESLALPGETYKLAFTPGLLTKVYQRSRDGQPPENLLPDPNTVLPVDLSAVQIADRGGYIDLDGDGHWWLPSGRAFHSSNSGDTAEQELIQSQESFFLPQRYRDPFGNNTIIAYDSYNMLPLESEDPLHNIVTAGERDTQGNITSKNDYRVLQPTLVTDPNRNRTAVAFDTLGIVVGTAVMGKMEESLGDSLADFEADLTDTVILDHFTDPLTDPYAILQRATTRLLYDVFAYQRTKDQIDPQPAVVYTLTRETHDADLDHEAGEQTRIQHSFSYSDGFGREIEKKIQAEPGPAPKRDTEGKITVRPDGQPEMTENAVSSRWVGSGWTIFNNKGKPVRKYEPFFADTHCFEFDVRIGVSPVLFYDPLVRVVATLHPNRTWEKIVVDPWVLETWDTNDTLHPLQIYDPRSPDVLPDHRFDPVNDPDVGHYFQRLSQSDYLPTWYGLRMDPERAADTWPDATVRANERTVAEKAARHVSTPFTAHFDSLGRAFLTIADNGLDDDGSERKYSTRLELDIEGNHREVIDAKDRIVMRYDYDMLGSRIHQASMEAGERWSLTDVTTNPVRGWDSRGHVFSTAFDELRRAIHEYLEYDDGARFLLSSIVYGERHQDSDIESGGQRLNLRGQVHLLYDQAGVVINERFDFKGNLLENSRRLASDYKPARNEKNGRVYNHTVDWPALAGLVEVDSITQEATALLEDEHFASSTVYDALNRPLALTTPDKSVTRPRYNEANLLEGIDVNLRSSGTITTFVQNIDYDAKGQRTRIQYGSGAAKDRKGVTTTYSYDPLTFRLTNIFSTRAAADFPDDCPDPLKRSCGLQNLHYTYDPAGNITHIRDDAQQTIFFRNQRVEPDAEYTYDATYRLIEAMGREHLGQKGGSVVPPTPTSHTDAPRVGLLHPGDGNAMGRYLQRYVYDEVGNFLEMQHRGSNPTQSGWTRTYAYDETSPLETGKVNNRLSNTTIGTTTETYDYNGNAGLHGNMTAMPHLPLMVWDFKDQLQASAKQVVNNGGRPELTYYVYDVSGQRVRKVTELGNSAREISRKKNERTYLGGFEIYREYNGVREDPALERETLHVMDDQQRIALVEIKTIGGGEEIAEPDEVIRFQLNNHLGSSSLELDESARVISYEEFYPYGSTSCQAVNNAVGVSAKRYRYTGMERDEETRLNYHGARYYAVWLGLWASCDPAGIAGGQALYQYASDNPITRVDPRGTLDEQSIPLTPVDQFFSEVQAEHQVSIPLWEQSAMEDISHFSEFPSSQSRRTDNSYKSEPLSSATSGPRWYQQPAFSYPRGRHHMVSSASYVDTGYGPVADFSWSLVMGVGNVCTMPVNAVSEFAGGVEDILESFGFNRGEQQLASLALMSVGIGEINILRHNLNAMNNARRLAQINRARALSSQTTTTEQGANLARRAQTLHRQIGEELGLGEIGFNNLTVGVSKPFLGGGDLHLVHVSNMSAYRAIASGRVRLRPNEILGGKPLFQDRGRELLWHVEELAAMEGFLLGARGGLVGTSKYACWSCGGKFFFGRDFPGWGHVNMNPAYIPEYRNYTAGFFSQLD